MLGRLKSNKKLKTVSDHKTPEIEDYESNRNDYTIIGIIGKGAFAKVYGAQCISKQKKKVAIKVIKLETDDDYAEPPDAKRLQISDIQQEAAIMSQLRHENIVSCYASFVVRDELWLIMPFVSGGSVAYILSHSLAQHFTHGIKDERILCCILKDTLSGIAYMHNQGRIHRDIKGRNILIDGENGTAMLADFGVSGALLEGGLKKRGRNTVTGTPCWMAPEVMKQQRYNHKADIWSLGITALELAFATTPYTKLKAAMKVMMEIMDGKTPTVDAMDRNNKFSGAFKKFVTKCLVKDPQKRLSAQELLGTEFIKKNAKDRQFMIQNFVRHIKKIEIKQCHEQDLPASIQGNQGLLKRKSTKYEVKIDGAVDENPQEEEDFNWSTTINSEDLEEENEQNTQIKGKFTVSTVAVADDNKKASKFTVTEVNGDVPKKSRFQVTQVDD